MIDEDALLAIGDRVVAMARDGEQVEAVVVHDRDTEIRVYEGDIESLSSAESQGVGIRVVSDQRQGFAYAGTFDDDVLAETLEDARDNAAFGTPDPDLGLAEPDGVDVADLDLWRDALASFPTDQKVDLAVDLERQVEVERPAARLLGVEIDLPRLAQGVRLDEVPLVVDVEPVIDRMILELGHEPGDVDGCHVPSLPRPIW